MRGNVPGEPIGRQRTQGESFEPQVNYFTLSVGGLKKSLAATAKRDASINQLGRVGFDSLIISYMYRCAGDARFRDDWYLRCTTWRKGWSPSLWTIASVSSPIETVNSGPFVS
jgi:hypothetical protein